MISVIEVYQDILDDVNADENGVLPFAMFNRISRRAELRMLDYLTGDVENQKPPFPDLSGKNRDWIADMITPVKRQVQDGFADKPTDYYLWDNAYILGSFTKKAQCDGEPIEDEGKNTTIDLLSTDEFTERQDTFIEGLKPSYIKPICKVVGGKFEFRPKDIGSIVIEYIRYPKFAKIVSTIDTVYNDEVSDQNASINYEWPEFAREMLVWFVADTFSKRTREKALREMNDQSGKLSRDKR